MPLFLGCPIWGSKRWVGTLFPSHASAQDFLTLYSSQFLTVEGNTTFYGMPQPQKMENWAKETPPGFQFCFKFPRTISHDFRLNHAETETQTWLHCLEELGDRGGPSFLQLPSDFSPQQLPILTQYIKFLSTHSQLRFAIEVRHPAWFEKEGEQALNQLLADHQMARVLYDVRGLRSAEPNISLIREALKKKPQVPVRFLATTDFLFIRYISHPEPEKNIPLFQEWANYLAPLLQAGKQVYFFMHHIDDFFMPPLCQHFYQILSQQVSLPPWSIKLRQLPRQESLF